MDHSNEHEKGPEAFPSEDGRENAPEMTVGTSAGIPVVLLAGGKNKPALESATGVTNKALIRINNRPMIGYMLEALSNAHSIADLVIVGGPELDPVIGENRRIDDTGTLLGNLLSGLKALGGKGKVLLAVSDTPFVTGPMIDEFIRQSLPLDVDLVYPIIPKEDNDRRFPGMKRTYAKLTEGTFTGGNMMLVDAEFMLRNEKMIADTFAARKHPLRLAGLLGWSLVFDLLLKRASIRQAEESASRMLRGSLKAQIVHHPEIGADVDKPSDVKDAERFLSPGYEPY